MPNKPSIKPQSVYFDTKSAEGASRVNKKFKLAGYRTPLKGVQMPYMFWVLTSQGGVYPVDRTVVIEQHHWENKQPKSLTEPYGYLCPEHYDVLTVSEIRLKRSDSQNGFKHVARLCDTKFEEFRDTLNKLKISPKFSVEAWRAMAAATSTPDNIDDILTRLHL